MSDVRIYPKIFIAQFIELYKSLPALWKIKSKEYLDRNKKAEAYQLMIEKLKEVEPNATRDMVIKKINNLRSSRRKEMNKVKNSFKPGASAEEIYHPSLWYYDLLEFLDDQEATRQPYYKHESLESEYNTDTDSNAEMVSNADVTSNSYNSIEYRPPSQSPLTNSNGLLLSNENGRRSSTPVSVDHSRVQSRWEYNGKRRRELEDSLSSSRGKRFNETRGEDSHDAFGRNVAHKLRNLPNEQRIFLEKLINDAIFEAELGNLNRNCYIHIPAPRSSNMTAAFPPARTFSSQASIYDPDARSVALQNGTIDVDYESNHLEDNSFKIKREFGS